MVDEDLGDATIVYEGPDGETVERTVENEHVAYFQDHWIVKTDGEEAGHDTVRRIPAARVYYVERDVEEFEREVSTVVEDLQSLADEFERGVDSLREEFQSVAGEVGTLLPGPEADTTESEGSDVVRIDIDEEADDGDANREDEEGS